MPDMGLMLSPGWFIGHHAIIWLKSHFQTTFVLFRWGEISYIKSLWRLSFHLWQEEEQTTSYQWNQFFQNSRFVSNRLSKSPSLKHWPGFPVVVFSVLLPFGSASIKPFFLAPFFFFTIKLNVALRLLNYYFKLWMRSLYLYIMYSA